MTRIAQGIARKTKPAPNRNGKGSFVPPLQNGDHLTVAEFERRYEAMPHVKKAELINGVVYMPSPVRLDFHGRQDSSSIFWLGYYWVHTPGTDLGGNTTMKLEIGENQPQPEAVLRIRPECGGQSKTEDGYLVGSAELAAEVSASSASYDLHEKLEEFEKNGVLEYIVWRVLDQEIDWFLLKGGKYQRLAKTKDGLYKSKVFPGLWLDADAMIAGDLLKVLAAVQKGIDSPEHKRFVKKLQRRSSSKITSQKT
jgi:Uma2 family endonuclease